MKKLCFNTGWTCNGAVVTLPHDAMIHETRKYRHSRPSERWDGCFAY